MEILHAFVLGLVQGLGEFLPISSSAHLILVPWIFGWKDPGLSFDVVLHLGTLVAVLVYFCRDILLLIRGFWRSLFKASRDMQNDLNQRMAWMLAVASVPGAVAGKLLEEQVENVFRNPLLVAGTLAGFGVILFVADRLGRKVRRLDEVGWLDAVLIGLSQALAIIPGVSRSGSTIALGLFLGFQRADAARFSFLMSIPIILGAGLVKARHFETGSSGAGLLVGFITAAVFGFLAIRYLLKYISNRSFNIFVWYRLILAAAIAGVWFARR